MNNKDIRKYDLVVEVGNQGSASAVKELATIDFNLAIDLWEYKMLKNINTFVGEDVFAILESVSESKLRAAVLGNSALQKLIYGVSEDSCTGANLQFLASLIVSSKINEAEDILKMVKNNSSGDFAERMHAVVDAVFALSMGKTGTKKATLNHKQTILLFDFVSKMKAGTTKNLLTQRLKEL